MKAKREPWVKWYFSDWRGDPKLRACSFAARGLWADLLAIMHECEPYGHLTWKGEAMPATRLARLTGGSPGEVEALLRELEEEGVFSRTRRGVIYSRRQVADDKRRRIGKRTGAKGGNPLLLSQRDVAGREGVSDGGDRQKPPGLKGRDRGGDNGASTREDNGDPPGGDNGRPPVADNGGHAVGDNGGPPGADIAAPPLRENDAARLDDNGGPRPDDNGVPPFDDNGLRLGPDNGGRSAQSPEARVQTPESRLDSRVQRPESAAPSPPTYTGPSPSDLHDATQEVGERILEICNCAGAYAGHFGEVAGWLQAGYDPALDILPTVAAIARRPRFEPPRTSLRYFTAAIREAHQRRLEAAARLGVTADARTQAGAPLAGADRDRMWHGYLTLFVEEGYWAGPGPEPGAPDCQVPDALLADYADGLAKRNVRPPKQIGEAEG